MITEVKSLEELGKYTAKLLDNLESGQMATVLGLNGDLGSGKTAFVGKLAENLGFSGEVTSPTFVIQKAYELPEGSKFSKIYHLDAYRLRSGEDLEKLGLGGILKEPNTLIVIEWPERVKDVLPEDTKYLDFKFINQTTREIDDGR